MNKKFTIIIAVIAILIIIYGIFTGSKEYKENLPTIQQASQNIEKCIITIQDNDYDVTEFRSKHSGGDVFKCGEDMTKAFQGKHKGYLPMIEKFKVQ